MSSQGSFWFNCSSLLFHAVLLSNSSGPVTTVLPLSSSIQPPQTTCVHFFYVSSLHLSVLCLWVRPPCTSAPVSCCMYKIQMLTSERRGGGRGGRSMHEWPWPAHTIHSSQGKGTALERCTSLDSFPSADLCGTTGPDVSTLTLENYTVDPSFFLSLQKHQHHSNLHTFLSPYVISQVFYPSCAFALKLGDAVK